MKYTIETTDYGCIETIEFNDGEKFTKRTERTESGCRSIDKDFYEQMELTGICEEILDIVCDQYDGFGTLNFLKLAELDY